MFFVHYQVNRILLGILFNLPLILLGQCHVEELVIKYSDYGTYSRNPTWKEYPTDTVLLCIDYADTTMYSVYQDIMIVINRQTEKPSKHSRMVTSLDGKLDLLIHWNGDYVLNYYNLDRTKQYYSYRDSSGNLMVTKYLDDVVMSISRLDSLEQYIEHCFYNYKSELTDGQTEEKGACIRYERWEDNDYTYEKTYYYDRELELEEDYAIYYIKRSKNSEFTEEKVYNRENKIIWYR